jgi:transposase
LHPAVAKDQPKYDRAVSEDRGCPGQFSLRDSILADRIKRLRTIPGVGPITVLTWDWRSAVSHASIQLSRPSAIVGSAARREAPDKLVRMPSFKTKVQAHSASFRGAAKPAPRYSHVLALVYERERQRWNKNRATLAVARKIVASLAASIPPRDSHFSKQTFYHPPF